MQGQAGPESLITLRRMLKTMMWKHLAIFLSIKTLLHMELYA